MLLIVWVQVRLSKERKKGDKIVSDSQERAFWRVYRPPPGCLSSLEVVPVSTRFRPGLPRPPSRKRTLTDLQREVSANLYRGIGIPTLLNLRFIYPYIILIGGPSTEQFDTHEDKSFDCDRKFEIIFRNVRGIRSNVRTTATFQSMDHRRSYVLAIE